MGSRTALVPSISEKVRTTIPLALITAPNSSFLSFSFYLASSFLYLPTLLPGAPIFLPITTSLMTTFTTPILNVTGRMTGAARYLRIAVSQILAV